MSFLAYLIGAVFLVWALQPLIKKDSTWISLHMEGDELEDRKQRVYGNIADLEFDYAMGRLSEADFTEIRRSFLSEAGKVIEMLEAQKSNSLMEQIKKDVQKLTGKKKHKHVGKDTNACSDCGTQNLAEAQFCMKCGKELA